MEINNTGFKKATLDNYLEYMTSDIQSRGTFGSDFTIKKEGVVDNVLATTANAMVSLEDKISYLIKQFNPYTAEGIFQDWLYAKVGLVRNYATFTVVQRTISGVAGTVINVNELVFSTSQDDQFYLSETTTISENGTVVGSFTAYESGSIPCDVESDLKIISAPLGVNAVYYDVETSSISLGDDYEDDTEFRARWIATNSIKQGSSAEGGIISALLPLVENNGKNLVVRQNRNEIVFNELPLHTMGITLRSGYSDNTIAQTIFDNLTDGVGLSGDTEVTIYDSEHNPTYIKFSRADEIPIYFNINVVLYPNYTLPLILRKIKDAIINNFDYAMGDRIIANDFYTFLNSVEGVDYVNTLEIQTGESGEEWRQTIPLNYNEYGVVLAENITVTTEE